MHDQPSFALASLICEQQTKTSSKCKFIVMMKAKRGKECQISGQVDLSVLQTVCRGTLVYRENCLVCRGKLSNLDFSHC